MALAPDRARGQPLLAASFERLSEESRYRRFSTTKPELSGAELDYLVEVNHQNHEAIVAIDPCSGKGLGVARYIRSNDDAEVPEVAHRSNRAMAAGQLAVENSRPEPSCEHRPVHQESRDA